MQSVEKQCRVLKLATAEHVGGISVKHAAFPWMVMHAADVLNKCQVQSDGRTAYEKIKGREYGGVLFEFGSRVLFKVSAKVQGGGDGTAMASRDLAR